MYQHYLTTIEGRVLHLDRVTGVVRDQDGDEVNGETVAYLSLGEYHRVTVGQPHELCYQPLQPVPIVKRERL